MNFSTITLAHAGRQIPFHFREGSVGDTGVISQIFKQNDYSIEQWFQGKCLLALYRELVHSGKRPLIIDAGANIGASPLWFSLTYPEALIFSIEPQRDNFALLERNTASIPYRMNFLGAIARDEGLATVHDPGLSDWGFRTERVAAQAAEPATTINTISPHAILSRAAKESLTPLIFKIDIEGAEAELFSGPTDWLEEIPLVAIELHDWMLPFSGASQSFLKAIASHEFDLVHRGENIFCFNRAILKRYQGWG